MASEVKFVYARRRPEQKRGSMHDVGQSLPQPQSSGGFNVSSMMSSQLDTSLEIQTRNKSVVALLEKESAHPSDITTAAGPMKVTRNDSGATEVSDLNNALPPKAKRKKHRPKVFKPPKTPKSATPKPSKAKEEKPSGKRKYVRKNTPAGLYPPEQTGDSRSRSKPTSAKRCLNIDGDVPRESTHPTDPMDYQQSEFSASQSNVQSLEVCGETSAAKATKVGRPKKEIKPGETPKPRGRPRKEKLDPLDLIIKNMKVLDINKSDDTWTSEAHGALVPYNGEFGALVPYKGEFGAIVPYEGKGKRKPARAKVNLDPVTALMWKLLMEPDKVDGSEVMDKDTEKWLDGERKIFKGRVDSFIARMHLVQGDRRFSPWKGSLVDSVVGVMLTQNVSDHISSSAFMALAAKFPAKPEVSRIPASRVSEENGDCSGLFGDSVKLQGGILVEEASNTTGSLVTREEKEGSSSIGAKKTRRVGAGKNKTKDWDSLRREVLVKRGNEERCQNAKDAVDWETVRQTDLKEISDTIRERGMNNMLSERIKAILNRLVTDHGAIDLEWLRHVDPDDAKEYLLSIKGLGLKSVECVRLLTLNHRAFPVDTNVARICVRLGWVPLQPLPESLQLHMLEQYPMLESIQKYLWPRLCELDRETLYEFHYQMITFGKVICTKRKPNCNACPMRADCKHFASAFASARLALPGPEEKSLVTPRNPIAAESCHQPYISRPVNQLDWNAHAHGHVLDNRQPIIEEPASPEPEPETAEESDIEDSFFDVPEEIPTIKLNFEDFAQNLKNYMQVNNIEIEEADMLSALVAITPEAASIPTPRLKNISRLRTEHQVYELPDSHPLLEGYDEREPDDPCRYLLSIWTPGETAQSTDAPKISCNSYESGKLCDSSACLSCNSIREAQAQIVRGTILIPCRTATRGSFPLNGTYFQVNEVFADHESSRNPVDIPRIQLWDLPKRTVYFGTSVPSISKGLTTEEIQNCFWKGYVCVRGFDRISRAPRPLYARLHSPAGKTTRNKRAAASAA